MRPPASQPIGAASEDLVGVLVAGQGEGRHVLVDLRLGHVRAVDVEREHVGVLGRRGRTTRAHDVEVGPRGVDHAARLQRAALVDGGHRLATVERAGGARMPSRPLSTKVSAEAMAMCMSRYW